MTMLFYILDANLNIIAAVDTYKSAIWTRRYYQSGDFELYVPATDEAMELMKANRYIIRADDTSQCAIIERVKITTDAEEGKYIIITGRTLQSILGRRIMWKQTTLSGGVEKVIRNMIRKNFIEPEIEARQIPNLVLGEELGADNAVKSQYTGDNIEEAIQDLCKTYKLGYNIRLDLEEKQFIFDLYRGADRSYNQSENPYVVFSNDFENLLSTEYTSDGTGYKNVVQVAGEGDGTARKKVTVGSAAGLDRFETFVNASQVSANEGEVTEDVYLSLLTQEGIEALAATGVKEAMDGEVEANYTYKLGTDYFLGDVVEVINEYGIAMTPRVTEIIESQSETGYTCIPTFTQDEEGE